MKHFKRILSIALGTSTVCPHHVHDESCGYAEGTPCGHEHTDCSGILKW